MPITVARGQTDQVIEQIIEVLQAYEVEHPDAQIQLYRQNSVSVRVRIVSSSFASQNRIERHDQVWEHLKPLSHETQSDISSLILLTPAELRTSLASMEFDDPTLSQL